jgi:hypothetical protein
MIFFFFFGFDEWYTLLSAKQIKRNQQQQWTEVGPELQHLQSVGSSRDPIEGPRWIKDDKIRPKRILESFFAFIIFIPYLKKSKCKFILMVNIYIFSLIILIPYIFQ